MREYFATLKRNANAWGDPLSALMHHPGIVWALGLGLTVAACAVIAWHYSSATPLTSAEPQSSFTSLSIDTLPTAPLPALSSNAEMTADGASSNDNSTRTRVSVNNESVAVPSNGVVHKEIKQDGATTHVDISSSSNTSGSSSSSSSLTVNLNTESDSETTTGSGP